MRTRHSKGGVRKQRGRWIGLWYENGKKKSRIVGLVKDMTKGDAREAVEKIITELRAKQEIKAVLTFGDFTEKEYFPYYTRKWKDSTRDENVGRVRFHLVSVYKDRELQSLSDNELQDLLDLKTKTHSFSVVDHLRWDLRQIFEMAVAKGKITLNPAVLLFTPKEAKKPTRRAMTVAQVRLMLSVLASRERLIAKLAILAGMRPGEIFAITWGRLTKSYVDIRHRVYRGRLGTPKTDNSYRQAALSVGLLADIEEWRAAALVTADNAWVFPSERMTPINKDNTWFRIMRPRLATVGLEWANFQVMRPTHSSLMKELKVDPKIVADQLGHTVDVNQNVYTQTAVEIRQAALNQLEERLLLE